MQPSSYSKKAHDTEGEDWFQAGTNVKYEDSEYSAEVNHMNPYKNRSYSSLSFDFQFMIGGDEVFCCYTVPYTYSEVLAHLEEVRRLHAASRKYSLLTTMVCCLAFKFIRFRSIGKSISGIDMPLLKISN